MSTRSQRLVGMRDTVAGSGSITEWLRVAQEVRGLGGLPGDPGQLRSTSATIRAAAQGVNEVKVDLDTLRKGKLPTIWTGLSSLAAGTAVESLGNRAGDIDAVLRETAAALDRLADSIERARPVDVAGRQAVDAAIALSRHLGPADYRQVRDGMVQGLDDLVRAARQHEDAALDATVDFRAIASRATAAQLGTGTLSPIEKVVLAAADDAAGPILTASDAAQAARNLNAWDFGARMRFVELLQGCGSDDERAWLLKALAAGRTMDEIAAFDAVVRPHAGDQGWLERHLRPLNPAVTGTATFMGAELQQFDGTTCGTMSLLVNRAMRDPVYALSLSHIDPPPANSADAARIVGERLVAEQQRIHTETNDGVAMLDWPRSLGTHPDDAAHWLSRSSGGVEYGWHNDVVNTTSTTDHVTQTAAAATAGNPSLLLIGDGYPDHYVMVVGENSAGVTVYNPATGQVTAVPAGELARESGLSAFGRSSLYAVITPNGA